MSTRALATRRAISRSFATPSHTPALLHKPFSQPYNALTTSHIRTTYISPSPYALQSPFSSLNFQTLSSRQFHSQTQLQKQAKPRDDVNRSQQPEASGQSADPKASSEKTSEEGNSERKGENQEGEGKKGEDGKKEAPPPPPPHGDKSPWQVFTETLQSEFKQSKEWNEGTKALASGAKDFTESEAVRKARSAYGAASEAASSTTGKVLKGTGKVIGQSAAWTWDTMPVKGLRAGVNATGSGIEKITRPVRETDAYKSVRDVIDDGSSSRYGGWTEKEQRRLNRERREMQEAAKSGRPMARRMEKAEEDPE